jgi:hypothetical protein
MASKANLIIDQGADFAAEIYVEDINGDPLDLRSHAARAHMKKHFTSSNSVIFTCAALEGKVTLALSAVQTMSLVPGRYVYDLEVVNSSNVVSRIVEGIVTVTPEVTK